MRQASVKLKTTSDGIQVSKYTSRDLYEIPTLDRPCVLVLLDQLILAQNTFLKMCTSDGPRILPQPKLDKVQMHWWLGLTIGVTCYF